MARRRQRWQTNGHAARDDGGERLTSTASKPAVLAASMALAAGAAIGLAVVAAVSPQATQTAVRAGLRAVALGGRADGFDMLIEGGGAR